MGEPIDFVICWVDGSDPEWLKEKKKYKPETSNDDRNIRYRDWGILKYWFRGVEKFAPWVNKIHFVTWGHIPHWLNTHHPKLNIVNHEDYIPQKYLPTFSSRPIEINFHRIKDLSEQFVFFNDDMFLLKPVKKKDFFKNALPRDVAAQDIVVHNDVVHSIAEFNAIMLINKHFSKQNVLKSNPLKWIRLKYGRHLLRTLLLMPWKNFTGFFDPHLPNSFLKSTFEEIWAKEDDLLEEVTSHKFRDKSDVTQYLFRSWQLASGNFIPRKNLGRIFKVDVNHNQAIKAIEKQTEKLICINDGDDVEHFDKKLKDIADSFEGIFPDKSRFEV